MKKILSITTLATCLCLMFTACSNDNENFFDDETHGGVTPGVYTADLVLSSNTGEKSDNIETRGLDLENGNFTNEYPYDYIYLHRADNQTGDAHKSIRIPLDRSPEYCDSCSAIHLDVEVLEDGRYIIRTQPLEGEPEEIILDADDEVYFSTISDTYWETTPEEEKTPQGNDVFLQDNEVNKELLSSVNTYTKEEIVNLVQEGDPVIEMDRHCTAFRVAFMFTNTNRDMNEFEWNLRMSGEMDNTDYAPENFYIKLYLGPNFCHSYNVEKDNVPENDKGGYYSVNNGEYAPFEPSTYLYEGGVSGEIQWSGFGYKTDLSNYLIAPLNKDDTRPFSLYAYIKYCPPGQESDQTDNGAKWIEIPINNFVVSANVVHYLAIALNYEELKREFIDVQNASVAKTRLVQSPEKIELKTPAKVICTYE